MSTLIAALVLASPLPQVQTPIPHGTRAARRRTASQRLARLSAARSFVLFELSPILSSPVLVSKHPYGLWRVLRGPLVAPTETGRLAAVRSDLKALLEGSKISRGYVPRLILRTAGEDPVDLIIDPDGLIACLGEPSMWKRDPPRKLSPEAWGAMGRIVSAFGLRQSRAPGSAWTKFTAAPSP